MPAVIETRGLAKHYGTTVALRGLDLDVYEGEILGYLGPNGAGKTTTIRLLLGLIEPTAGHATVFGLDATRQAPEIHRRLAYVPGAIERLTLALHAGDVPALGHVAELDALSLHACMMTTDPPQLFWVPDTVALLHDVWAFRREHGPTVYFSIDAGPNVFLMGSPAAVERALDELPTLRRAKAVHRSRPGPPIEYMDRHLF